MEARAAMTIAGASRLRRFIYSHRMADQSWCYWVERAILLTAMIASFGLLANGPILVADPSSHWNWTESALNLALIGAAWVVADSFGGRDSV